MNRKITVGILAALLAICAIAFGTSRMAPPGSSPSPPPAPTPPSAPTETLPVLDPSDFRVVGRVRLGPPGPRQSPSQPAPTPPAQPPAPSCNRPPSIKFKSWTVGRSSGTAATRPLSFITNNETTCKVTFEVTYNGSQSPNTCEITSDAWNMTMSHGFTVTSTETVEPSGSGFSKVWTYKATLKGNSAVRIKDTKCNANKRGPGLKTDYPGRNGERMWLSVHFTGTHSGGTVGVSLALAQDEIDGLRQEYVDWNRQVVPARGKFTLNSGSVFNWGHYRYLIDQGLDVRREAWAKWTKPSFTKESFYATSGFRHPHHNSHCVPGARNSSHQYGNAIDVRGRKAYDRNENWINRHMDFTGPKGTPDGKVNSYERNEMFQSARRAGAFYRKIYPTGHLHADWRPSDWNKDGPLPGVKTLSPARGYNTPPPPSNNGGDDDDEDEDDDDGADGGTSTDTAPAAPAAPTTSTPTTVACGNRWRGSSACTSGGRASSRTAHQSTCGAGHSYWSCNSSAVAWHATSYTCTRSGCGLTYTKCSKGNGSCRARRPGGGTYQWHN